MAIPGVTTPESLESTHDYFNSTFAPTFSRVALILAASSLFTPSFTGLGAPSTKSLASLRPRPVSARTSLITSIFFSPAAARTTVNSVFSSAAAAAAPPAAGSLERAELRRLLDEALATLPEAHRQAFVLHTDGELPYREVAQVQGVPIGTVMSRLYYARRKLQAYLFPQVAL